MPWTHYTADVPRGAPVPWTHMSEVLHALRQRYNAVGWGDFDATYLSEREAGRWPPASVQTPVGRQSVGAVLAAVAGAYTTGGEGGSYVAAPWWTDSGATMWYYAAAELGYSEGDALALGAHAWAPRAADFWNTLRRSMPHLRECVLVPSAGELCTASGEGSTWAAAVAASFAATPSVVARPWTGFNVSALLSCRGQRLSATRWYCTREWLRGQVPAVESVAMGAMVFNVRATPRTGVVRLAGASAAFSNGELARVVTSLGGGGLLEFGPAAAFDATAAFIDLDPSVSPDVSTFVQMRGHNRTTSETAWLGPLIQPAFDDL